MQASREGVKNTANIGQWGDTDGGRIKEHLCRPKYRADIDGLRAVAVLLVVLFHAFPDKIRGGFVGVDVFFVISGFLISTIIFENIERQTFSFTEFYARRIKRIFPALILVLLFSLIFGWFALLGDEYKQLAEHIAGGVGFVSNFVLWSESGYFDNFPDTKPLLHLWSLGIEEQFYIAWPLLIWLCGKSRLSLITVSVLVISFTINVATISNDAVWTFYSPLSRMWELSVGGLLAWLSLHSPVLRRLTSFQSSSLSLVGVVCLSLALILIDKGRAFPGWWALLPVIGAMLIIAAGAGAWFNRAILSHKVAVWFGLISFPLYLWHWPLLSFERIVEREVTGISFRISAVLFAILLAWLTFRFVERDIRFTTGFKFVNKLIFAMLAIGSAGAFVFINDGMRDRKSIAYADKVYRQFVGPFWKYTKNAYCLNRYPFPEANNYNWWFCTKSGDGDPTLIILGSSYANQLYPGFVHNYFLRHHVVLSIGTCDIASKLNFELDHKHPCSGQNLIDQIRLINDIVAKERSIRFVVIGGLNGPFDEEYISLLRKRIDYYEGFGVQVIIFTTHMAPGFHPKACFPTPLKRLVRDCTFPLRERQARFDELKPVIDALSKSNPKVRFFEQNEMYCRNGECSFVLNGMPLHRDEAHLSEFGSIELQKHFTEWARQNVPGLFDTQIDYAGSATPLQ